MRRPSRPRWQHAQAEPLATSDIATSSVVSTGIVGWPYDPWYMPYWESYELLLQPYGPSAVATSTLTLDVKTQVLPPEINVPAATQSTTPTAPLVFSNTGGNAISITDPGVGMQPIQVTLNTNFATLTLGSTTGVTISGAGNGSSYVTITGSVADINSAGRPGLYVCQRLHRRQ